MALGISKGKSFHSFVTLVEKLLSTCFWICESMDLTCTNNSGMSVTMKLFNADHSTKAMKVSDLNRYTFHCMLNYTFKLNVSSLVEGINSNACKTLCEKNVFLLHVSYLG